MSRNSSATIHPLHAERIKPVGHLPRDMYMGEWSAKPRPADLDKPPAPPPMQTPPCLLEGSEAAKQRLAARRSNPDWLAIGSEEAKFTGDEA